MNEPTTTTESAAGRRAGMFAVVGRANVGKSSLMNALVGEKISIVSPIAQTTRSPVRGILTEPRGQLVFVDTPGVHKAEGSLGRVMNKNARAAVEGVDAVLLVVDGSQPARDEDRGWISRLLAMDIPVVVAVNKSDLSGREAPDWKGIWAGVEQEKSVSRAPRWARVSAATGAGLQGLVNELFAIAPVGELLFPEDIISDYPRKLAVADLIREKLFGVLREELPHAVAVWVEKIDEAEDGAWTVHAQIFVNKPSQKGIVLGEKGRLLRKVRRQSEAELKAIYERPVTVELWVKIEKDWGDNFWLLKKFGYVP